MFNEQNNLYQVQDQVPHHHHPTQSQVYRSSWVMCHALEQYPGRTLLCKHKTTILLLPVIELLKYNIDRMWQEIHK